MVARMGCRVAFGWICLLWLCRPAFACVGDCNRDCQVDVSEIIVGIGIALGEAGIDACASFDADGSDAVEVHEIVGAVQVALDGCARELSFAEPTPYEVGNAPRSLVLHDFDGDGFLDVATGNHGSDDVSLLINDGKAVLAEQDRVVVGHVPLGIAAGDFDGDGNGDVATANGGSANVSVLFGNGDGQLGRRVDLPAGTDARTILAADVDGNGELDLVVAAPGIAGIPVLLGRGDGTFERIVVGSGFRSWWIAHGDVTGDGIADLVSANAESSDLAVLAGRAGGGFTQRLRTPLAEAPFSVAIADVDHDGAADLVTGNGRNASLSLLRGQGGTFAEPVRLAVGEGPFPVHIADVDGDGNPDLLTVTESTASGDVSIRLGHGDGTFAEERRWAVGRLPYAVAIGDLDRDGALDVIAATGTANQVVVLRQVGCGR